MTSLRVPNAVDADVFAAFLAGRALAGDNTSTSIFDDGVVRQVILRSHGIPIAVATYGGSEDGRIVFDKQPTVPGGRCVCRLMAHAHRVEQLARRDARVLDGEVAVWAHDAFIALCERVDAGQENDAS